MTMLATPRLHTRWYQNAVRNLSVVAYVRRDDLGSGPAFSLYRGTVELARFDLFVSDALGTNGAHYHFAREPRQPRHFYPAGLTLGEYLDLAIADLVRLYPSAAGAVGWIRRQITELAVLAIAA